MNSKLKFEGKSELELIMLCENKFHKHKYYRVIDKNCPENKKLHFHFIRGCLFFKEGKLYID